jgi:hypothetical protein
MDSNASSQLKVVMTATGTVQNPDGTVRDIQLYAERPLTDAERAEHQNTAHQNTATEDN